MTIYPEWPISCCVEFVFKLWWCLIFATFAGKSVDHSVEDDYDEQYIFDDNGTTDQLKEKNTVESDQNVDGTTSSPTTSSPKQVSSIWRHQQFKLMSN